MSEDPPIPAEVGPEWDRILATLGPERVASRIHDAVFDSPYVFPLQRRAELEQMLYLATLIEPNVVVEIGADKGGGFFHLVDSLPTVEVAVAIEIRGVPYAESFARAYEGRVQVRGIGWSSRHPATLGILRGLNRQIDFLFLDGEKAHVADDFETYLPLMAPRGIVCIHDIVDPIEPSRFFRSLQGKYLTEEIIETSAGAEARARRQRGEEPRSAYDGWLMHWGENSCGVRAVQLP